MIRIFRNGPAPTRRWGWGVIRHRGTRQVLIWAGPAFILIRLR